MLKSVLLLGSRGGLGRAIGSRLTEDGWTVVGADLPELDLARPDVASAVARLQESHGGFDALVHAAGLYPAAPVSDGDEELFDRVLTVNARSAFAAGAQFVRRCVAAGRPGAMVFVSSGAATRARPGTAVYAASKAALDALVRAFALEHGRDRIRCNAVAPGFVDVGSQVNPVPRSYVEGVEAASERAAGPSRGDRRRRRVAAERRCVVGQRAVGAGGRRGRHRVGDFAVVAQLNRAGARRRWMPPSMR